MGYRVGNHNNFNLLYVTGISRGIRIRKDGQLSSAWAVGVGEVYGLRKDLQSLDVLLRFTTVRNYLLKQNSSAFSLFISLFFFNLECRPPSFSTPNGLELPIFNLGVLGVLVF